MGKLQIGSFSRSIRPLKSYLGSYLGSYWGRNRVKWNRMCRFQLSRTSLVICKKYCFVPRTTFWLVSSVFLTLSEYFWHFDRKLSFLRSYRYQDHMPSGCPVNKPIWCFHLFQCWWCPIQKPEHYHSHLQVRLLLTSLDNMLVVGQQPKMVEF